MKYLEKMTWVDALAAIVLGIPISYGMIWAGIYTEEMTRMDLLIPFLTLL